MRTCYGVHAFGELLSSVVFDFFAPSMGPSERQYSDLSDISPDDRKRCAL